MNLPAPLADAVSDLTEQARDLCKIHGHPTRVIGDLEINEEWFEGYGDPERARFELKSMARLFLYMYALDFTQAETARRVSGAAYVYIRFNLHRPPTQQAISHNKRNRFNREERIFLREAAKRIRKELQTEGILSDPDEGEPRLEPEDMQGTDIEEDQIMAAVQQATELGFGEFNDPRAPNISHALEVFFERQGYLNMANAGTTTPRRRFARLSEYDDVPHGSTHYDTMRKVANPEPQLTMDQFQGAGTQGVPE